MAYAKFLDFLYSRFFPKGYNIPILVGSIQYSALLIFIHDYDFQSSIFKMKVF